MLERRCNFCGDLLPEEPFSLKVPNGPARYFQISIDIQDCSSIEVQSDPNNPFAEIQSAMLGMMRNPYSSIRGNPDFHACFGCSAHIVAVAYDQYAKEKR